MTNADSGGLSVSGKFGEGQVFLGIVIFTVLAGLLFILLLKPLKRLTHGVEDDEKDLSKEAEISEIGETTVE